MLPVHPRHWARCRVDPGLPARPEVFLGLCLTSQNKMSKNYDRKSSVKFFGRENFRIPRFCVLLILVSLLRNPEVKLGTI